MWRLPGLREPSSAQNEASPFQEHRRIPDHPTGIEGAQRLATMARAHSGCDVLQQNFLKLSLPAAHFDGVFANAVLFHVPSQA